jgi:hypothetical protein
MQVVTKRALIATAALAAAGLFGSLPYQGPQAMQGAPTVHRDVALVDDSSTILPPETSFDTTLFNDVLGSTGAEEQLYQSLVTADGATEAQTLLDTDGASPVYSGVFNGAESRAFEGLFINGLVYEDQLNQALGVTELNSQTALLADLVDNPGPSIPGSADVTIADLTNALGTSTFDTDLTQIATADYSDAVTDFEGYLESFASSSDLGGLTGILGDLGGGGLGSLGTDLTTILDGLAGLL